MLLMRKYDEENSACLLSHPVRGAWIEIELPVKLMPKNESHPVRGVWIEILCNWLEVRENSVAPRQGCVD